jgi:hypothetical protein
MCQQITELLTRKIKDTFHTGTKDSKAILIFFMLIPLIQIQSPSTEQIPEWCTKHQLESNAL